jgi:hypothetical protein
MERMILASMTRETKAGMLIRTLFNGGRQMNSYINTVPISGPELAKAESAAKSEEYQVLALYHGFPDCEFSPCQVQELLDKHKKRPLTNWRRAITNLTTKTELEQTGNKIIGIHGRKVNTWQLRKVKPEQKALF